MRSCVLVRVVVAVGVAASCSKKPAPTPAMKLEDRMPRVQNAAVLAPASVELPRVVALFPADGWMKMLDRRQPWEEPILPEPEDDDVTTAPDPMILDEGKMGKKDSARAEGQYRIRKTPTVIERRRDARQEAYAQAGVAGIIAPTGAQTSFADLLADRPRPRMAGRLPPEAPVRLSKVIAESIEAPVPPRLPALLVAGAPAAHATDVVDFLTKRAAFLAVAHGGAIDLLRIAFLYDGTAQWEPDWQPWMEVRITRDGVVVEAVPGDPVALPANADGKALADAFTKERAARGISERLDVDVLIDASVDLQRLVDVLVALDGAGARLFAIGTLPAAGDPELAKRGKRITIAQLEELRFVGGLSRAQLEDVIVTAYPAVKTCYETGRAKEPAIAGKVSTQFFIAPNGTVVASNASGVHGEVAACIADVMRGLEFPKPGGGGGVQVNAPFILRH